MGLISDQDIYSVNQTNEPIGNHHLNLFSPHVYQEQHILDVMEMVAKLKLTLIPVLSSEKKYVGSITMQDLMVNLAREAGFDQPGSILILTMTVNDYSLAEISRIVEENGAKVVTLFVASNPDTMKLNVHIKVNTTDLTSLIRSLERYEYQVIASFQEDEDQDDFYRGRYEEFMRYMNT